MGPCKKYRPSVRVRGLIEERSHFLTCVRLPAAQTHDLLLDKALEAPWSQSKLRVDRCPFADGIDQLEQLAATLVNSTS
jgi:hypothetical protein